MLCVLRSLGSALSVQGIEVDGRIFEEVVRLLTAPESQYVDDPLRG